MAKDIIYNNDIEFENGDFKIGDSDLQHVEHVLRAYPGNYKASPWLGVGIEDFKSAPMTASTRQKLEREIKLQLESDGATNTFVKIDNQLEDVKIRATYE